MSLMSSRIAVPLSMPGMQISRTSLPGRTPSPAAAATLSTGARSSLEHAFWLCGEAGVYDQRQSLVFDP